MDDAQRAVLDHVEITLRADRGVLGDEVCRRRSRKRLPRRRVLDEQPVRARRGARGCSRGRRQTQSRHRQCLCTHQSYCSSDRNFRVRISDAPVAPVFCASNSSSAECTQKSATDIYTITIENDQTFNQLFCASWLSRMLPRRPCSRRRYSGSRKIFRDRSEDSSDASPRAARSTRLTATVTISVPGRRATCASRMI